MGCCSSNDARPEKGRGTTPSGKDRKPVKPKTEEKQQEKKQEKKEVKDKDDAGIDDTRFVEVQTEGGSSNSSRRSNAGSPPAPLDKVTSNTNGSPRGGIPCSPPRYSPTTFIPDDTRLGLPRDKEMDAVIYVEMLQTRYLLKNAEEEGDLCS
eukprot:TRINITY_DN12460_c0_g1_i1.p1 TRINITY_DN12460_c0_g1~~TRINITY_DN12460_c0_g1_i1.p1  ORF type:complete len:159 (+),score=30.01 TRINITY_DN12460_c0_g1_i1:22-477(+)